MPLLVMLSLDGGGDVPSTSDILLWSLFRWMKGEWWRGVVSGMDMVRFETRLRPVTKK